MDVAAAGARRLGEQLVARSRRRAWASLLAGLALLAAGFAGFGVYGDRADELRRSGGHATATVTSTTLYGGRYSRNSFGEHIDVEFAYPGGYARGVRIWIGEEDRFWVGEQVQVVYDLANPKRAELADGRGDIGPIGFLFFAGLAGGAILLVVGTKRWRLCRAARRVLTGDAWQAIATPFLKRRGGRNALALQLSDPEGNESVFWPAIKRGWSTLSPPSEVSVFGQPLPGHANVVVDSQRAAVAVGRLPGGWRRRSAAVRRLPASDELPRQPSSSFALARPIAIVLFTLLVSVFGLVWAVHAARAWKESDRIQSGPRTIAIVVSAGQAAGASQVAILSYHDRTSREHRTRVHYPLALGGRVIPGMSTSVVFDPASPEKAELQGHPRHRWQTAALAMLLTALATALAIFCVPLVRRTTRSGVTRTRTHLYGVLAGVALLLLGAARLGLVVLVSHQPQENVFPPPPLPVAAQPISLPSTLSALPPTSGPLITPKQARAIVELVWPLRDKALAAHDLGTLKALEAGPALAVDVGRMLSGDAPNRPQPAATGPSRLQTYTPKQTRWPLRFLAEALTSSAGQPFLELMIFSRTGPSIAWKVIFDSGFSAGSSSLHLDPGIFDPDGYNVVPSPGWIKPEQAVPALARYWQSWRETGRPPASGPRFRSGGYWTTVYGEKVANRQDQRGDNGLPEHISYGDRSTPATQVWTFGIYGSDQLVCAPMHQTTVWTGPAHQNADRSKWGSQLPPGVYSAVTAEILREPCIIVPAIRSDLIPFGADRWVVALSGQPAT